MLELAAGTKTKEECIEVLRKKLVAAMLYGKTLVLNTDNLQADWVTEWTAGEADFPSTSIFNWDEWRQVETYRKVVRPDENHSITGESGIYVMSDDFTIFLLAKYVDDDTCRAFCEKVPNSEAMGKFIVE